MTCSGRRPIFTQKTEAKLKLCKCGQLLFNFIYYILYLKQIIFDVLVISVAQSHYLSQVSNKNLFMRQEYYRKDVWLYYDYI